MIIKRYLAIFLTISLVIIICAPAIVASIDKSADTSIFFGLNEEEEKEDMKIVFEILSQNFDTVSNDYKWVDYRIHNCNNYLKPHLNIVFPPPEVLNVYML